MPKQSAAKRGPVELDLSRDDREAILTCIPARQRALVTALRQSGSDQAVALSRRQFERLVGYLTVALNTCTKADRRKRLAKTLDTVVAPALPQQGLPSDSSAEVRAVVGKALAEVASDADPTVLQFRVGRQARPPRRAKSGAKGMRPIEAAAADRPLRRVDDPSQYVQQFRVELVHSDPPIWRRIQVPDGTLNDLHWMIQGAFGWECYHLHQFIIDGGYYLPTTDEEFFHDDRIAADDATIRVSELLLAYPPRKRIIRWQYEYDFGDSWMHEVTFEGFVARQSNQRYPLCIDGARAGPPEDIGGIWGYAELLESRDNPQHPMYDDYQGMGLNNLDPEAFDPQAATRNMHRMAPKRRSHR